MRGGERSWVAAWVAAIVALSLLPYLVGYRHSSPDAVFLGHVDPVHQDAGYHLGWAKQASKGRVLLEYQLSGRDTQTRLTFNLLFLSIGWTARLLDIPLPIAFQIVRCAVAVVLLWLIYLFVRRFVPDRSYRWFALGLIALSGGLGWIEMLGIASWPPGTDQLWRPCGDDACWVETSTFWHMRWDVVTTPAVALLLGVFLLSLRFLDTRRWSYALAAGAATVALALVHPHELTTVFAVLGAYLLLDTVHGRIERGESLSVAEQWPRWGLLIVIGTMAVPVVGYYLVIISRDSVLWSAWQPIEYPIPQLLMGFGVPSVLALVGVVSIVASRRHESYFPLLWPGLALVLLRIPVPPLGQTFLLDGLHVPVCVLAAHGAQALVEGVWPRSARAGANDRLRTRLLGTVAAVVLALSWLTSVLDLANEVALARGSSQGPFYNQRFEIAAAEHAVVAEPGNATASPYFLPGDLWAAYAWLDEHADPSDVVLAAPYLTTLVPYLSGNRVFFGNLESTVDSERKLAAIRRFFDLSDDGARDEERRELIEKGTIDYVLFWVPAGPGLAGSVAGRVGGSRGRVVHEQGRAAVLATGDTYVAGDT